MCEVFFLLNNSQLGVYRRLCGLRAPITQDKYCDTHNTHTRAHTCTHILSLSAIPGLTVYLDTVDGGNGMYQLCTSIRTQTHIYVTYRDASYVAYLHLFPPLWGCWIPGRVLVLHTFEVSTKITQYQVASNFSSQTLPAFNPVCIQINKKKDDFVPFCSQPITARVLRYNETCDWPTAAAATAHTVCGAV